MRRTGGIVLTVLLAAGVATGACGDDDETEDTPTASTSTTIAVGATRPQGGTSTSSIPGASTTSMQ